MMRNRSSEVIDATRVLMRKGQREEACILLAEARDRAAAEGLPEEASTYSSVLGSYLVAMGRDTEAQSSYRDAEKFSNGDALDKLITARHLIYGMGRPEEGFKRTEEVLSEVGEGTTLRQEALAVQGLARLAMDQPEEATISLEKLLSNLRSSQVLVSGSDLTLIEELLKRHQAIELCRAYLDLAEPRARVAHHQEVLAHILAIKNSF